MTSNDYKYAKMLVMWIKSVQDSWIVACGLCQAGFTRPWWNTMAEGGRGWFVSSALAVALVVGGPVRVGEVWNLAVAIVTTVLWPVTIGWGSVT